MDWAEQVCTARETMEAAIIPTKEELKEMAGIPHLPTDLTYECRLALYDEGPRAYDWSDNPHRLVFDLCREVERLTAERDAALNPSGSPAAS